jgi:hypothetical protein
VHAEDRKGLLSIASTLFGKLYDGMGCFGKELVSKTLVTCWL